MKQFSRSKRKFARFSRSWKLLRAFPLEQRNPAIFYSILAQDTVDLVKLFCSDSALSTTFAKTNTPQIKIRERKEEFNSLQKPVVLDVGAGPGFFAEAFLSAQMQYISVEPDVDELFDTDVIASADKSDYYNNNAVDSAVTSPTATTLCASGYALPICDNSCDIVLCSNIFEHVQFPWQIAHEMLRVCRPGGLIIMSYTVWFGPFGGHETGLWHYLGGRYAAHKYWKKNGHNPKNHYGYSLFRRDVKDGLRWLASQEKERVITPLAIFPRYHPWWAWWMVRIPGLRELTVCNLALVMQKN